MTQSSKLQRRLGRSLVLSIAVALLLGLQACGGGGDDDAAPLPAPAPVVIAPLETAVPPGTSIWTVGATAPMPNLAQQSYTNERQAAVTVQPRAKGAFTGAGIAGGSGNWCVQLQYYIQSPSGATREHRTLFHDCWPAATSLPLDKLQNTQLLQPGERITYLLLLVGALDVAAGGGMQVNYQSVSLRTEILAQ